MVGWTWLLSMTMCTNSVTFWTISTCLITLINQFSTLMTFNDIFWLAQTLYYRFCWCRKYFNDIFSLDTILTFSSYLGYITCDNLISCLNCTTLLPKIERACWKYQFSTLVSCLERNVVLRGVDVGRSLSEQERCVEEAQQNVVLVFHLPFKKRVA